MEPQHWQVAARYSKSQVRTCECCMPDPMSASYHGNNQTSDLMVESTMVV